MFSNEKEIRIFVRNAEDRYLGQICAIAEQIASDHSLKFLTMSGPTCSGKTTTSHILKRELEARNIPMKIISIDDFYRNSREITNFESIEAIDLEILAECINDLKKGRATALPTFDFLTGTRGNWHTHTSVENEIILLEGIQAFYPEVTALLPKDHHRAISINVTEDAIVGGVRFEKREVRFLRRLVRDYLFRNATPSRTLFLWNAVVENEDKNILPYEKNADFQINSFLAYELNVIKHYIFHVVTYDLQNPEEAVLLAGLQKKFHDIQTIDSNFVPENSVFREFIGK